MLTLTTGLIMRLGILLGTIMGAYYWIKGNLPEAQMAYVFVILMQLFVMEK